MTILELREHWLRTAAAVGFAVAIGFGAPAFAQDEEAPPAGEPAAEAVVEEAEAEEAAEDTITVTGSRIRRDEFSSASPIQVIDGQVSRELGIFDTAKMLQETTVASGLQIDNTFTGFVLDNGPGASTLALRGIDPERTLILVNGRRLGNGGSEGAPTAPDLNLIPSSLIARIDILLDGASPVYGSDAVAGVANILLRNDFDGFEIEGALSYPEAGGGEQAQFNATWGVRSDRGFIAAAAEYYRREQMSVSDRGLFCNMHWEEDTEGNIRHNEIAVRPGTQINPCKQQIIGRFRNVFGPVDPEFVGRHSDYFFTTGSTNIGIPNYSDEFDFSCMPILVPRPDGLFHRECSVGNPLGNQFEVDVKDPLYNGADGRRSIVKNADLVSPLERLSFMAFGDYRIESLNDMEVFFEFSYGRRKSFIQGDGAQVFPAVPASNPTNPCGNEAVATYEGVPCGRFVIVQQPVLDENGDPVIDEEGIPVTTPVVVPVGVSAVPIVLIEGDRNTTEVQQNQTRMVAGIRGDLPFWNDGPGDGLIGFDGWNYELSGLYHRSFGTSVRRGILEDRLILSLFTTVRNPDGSLRCGVPVTEVLNFLTPLPCVPVDLFSDSVQLRNELSPEEHEYLFGVRTFETEIQQYIISGFVGGDVMNLPAGKVGLVIGGEYRKDEIDSRPDDNAEDGEFIGFFADKGATGHRELKEGFAEIRIPIMKDVPLFHELTLEAAGRVTNETFYGTNWVYGLKGRWLPTEWLTFRGSYGTHFRAPNARELFFNGATGFVNPNVDPCIVPIAAGRGTGVYNSDGDNRTPTTINNCIMAGVNPFTLGLSTGVSSIEVETGGTTDISAETSRSYTVGTVVDVPYTQMGMGDKVRTQLSVTYFDIEVSNTIEEPGVAFLFNECYVNNPNLSSGFCGRITRDPATGFVDLVDAGFINIGLVTSKGFDFNAVIGYDGFTVGGHGLDLSLDLRATMMTEQIDEVLNTVDNNVGEIGTPKWRGQATLFADWADWRGIWRTRYIGDMNTDAASPFGNGNTCREFINTHSGTRFLRNAAGQILDINGNIFTGAVGQIPLTEAVVNRDLSDSQCRDVNYLGEYFTHDMSLTWRRETWSISAGINNVFDVLPPRGDSAFVLTSDAGNFPLGVGYDFFGRSYFINATKRF